MDLFHKLHRLKHISRRELPRVIRSKAMGMATAQLERLLYTTSGPRFRKPIRPLRALGLFHTDVLTKDFASFLLASYGEEAAVLVSEADLAADWVIDLLGSGPVDLKKLGTDFWHKDFKSGFAWPPHAFFTGIRHGEKLGADIKVPWELSRFQHFIPLAQAYALTRDEAYAVAYFSQIEAWIRSNPPKFGVNWVCPMDIALRAGNWLAAWDIFQYSPSVTRFFEDNFTPILWEHGHHIRRHLEWGADVSSNHYLSDLLGLFNIGLALDEPEWVQMAQSEFARELFRQTYDDGFDYEGSTAYHRLVLEIFLYYALVCSRHAERAQELGAVFLERLTAMFEAVNQLLALDGTVPSIGDNDSGRVHVPSKRDDADMRYLSSLGALLLNQPKLKVQEWEAAPEPAWLFGMAGIERLRAMKGPAVSQIRSKKNSQSGLVTIRGANDVLFFCAAPNGTRGVGNHTHNDKLSFCLWVNGEWFFVDPGTGVYTSDPALRNRLRSTRAHNTVMVDGQEQNRIEPGSLFALSDDAQVTLDERSLDAVVEGAHTGYQRLGVVHRRRIDRVSPLKWGISDQFQGNGAHAFEWNFHLAPGLKPQLERAGARIAGRHGAITLISSDPGLRVELAEDVVSPRYGVTIPGAVIRFSISANAPFEAKFEIMYNPTSS